MSLNPVSFTRNKDGKVLKDVELHLVFWGKHWQTDKLTTTIRDKVALILNSGYLSGLSQYTDGQPVTVKLAPPDNDTSQSEPSNNFADDPNDPDKSEVKHAISDWIRKSPTSASDPLYVVFMPPGVTCKDPKCDGATCAGQHFYFEDPQGRTVYYAWVLYGSGSIERITTLFSEELVEAITNPEPPTGWGMVDNFAVRREISDVCEAVTASIGPKGNRVFVKTYYSNKDEDCIAPGRV